MRYRKKLDAATVAKWIGPELLVVSLGLIHEKHPFKVMGQIVIGLLVLHAVVYLLWDWEIRPDRLIHHRFFRRTVWPFTEITYVGPVTGEWAGQERTRDWIEVRNIAGESAVIQSGNPEAFLTEMREYAPQIALKARASQQT